MAIYVVNCLVPDDASIRITRQMRSVDQSSYTLDFTVGDATAIVAGRERDLPDVG